MIGSLIGAGISIASSIAGGIKARKEKKKQKRMLKAQMQENDNWYNSEYYKDVLDNPESRAYLKTISDKVYKQDQAAENRSVMMGATHENALAAKQAANEVMSGAVNDVVARQAAQKSEVRRQYLSNKRNLQNGQMDVSQQTAKNWMDSAGNIGNAAMSLGNTLDKTGFFSRKR